MPSNVFPRRQGRTIEHRFMEKVWFDPETGCMEWMAYRMPHGYGMFGWQGRMKLAHRFAYTWGVGPIPEGLTLDHLCRNRACQNPEHMEPVTGAENTQRGAAAREPDARCAKGHEFTPENTYIQSNGCRRCRICRRAYMLTYKREWRRKRRADTK